MVEFAIAMPLFLLFTLGLLAVGRGVMVRQLMVNAAREGARLAVLPGADAPAVVTAIENYLDGVSIAAPNKTVTIKDANGNVVNDLNALKSKDLIELELIVPYSEIAWGGKFMIPGNLEAQVVMRKE